MEKEKNKRKKIQLLLLISLFIHALFVCLVFRYSFQKGAKDFFKKIAQYVTPEEIKQKKEEKKQKQQKILQALQQLQPQHKVAALKPKKSNFGWVMFDDPPDRLNPEKVDVPTTTEGMAGQSITPDATEEKIDNKKIKKLVKEKKSKLKPDKKDITKKQIQASSKKKMLKKQASLIKEKQVNKPQLDKEKRIENIKKLQEKINSLKEVQKPKAQARGARSIEKKPKRNIIALTKGFVENLKDEGDDPIKREGDENLKASFEDLKYLSYETKIDWCLQAAWKQNFAYKARSRPIEGKATIKIIIDKHGNLIKNTMLQSSGNPELDQMIMQSTQQATPFPPLPKHFETDVYTISRIVHVTMNHYSF